MNHIAILGRVSTLCLGVWLLSSVSVARGDAVITFNEPTSTSTGFNGMNNPYLLSSDGAFRVEAFWLNTSGHFHLNTTGGNTLEVNHNQSGGANSLSQLQGVRITRTDSGLFDLVSMGIHGEASVGQLSNYSTGAGTWTLFSNFSGTADAPGTVVFSGFTGLSEIFIADPRAAGGTSFSNSWDNISLAETVSVAPVPLPAAAWAGMALFGVLGGVKLRRSRQSLMA